MKCNDATLKHKLTPEKRKALNELSKRNDIILTNEGNDREVITQNVKDYIKVAERKLINTEYYTMLGSDSTETLIKLVDQIVD